MLDQLEAKGFYAYKMFQGFGDNMAVDRTSTLSQPITLELIL